MSERYPAHSLLPGPGSNPDDVLLRELRTSITPTREDDETAAIRVDNDERAERALLAVNAYADATYYGLDGETIATAFGDLLGDLRHACDAAGLDFEAVASNGAMHYAAEIRGEL